MYICTDVQMRSRSCLFPLYCCLADELPIAWVSCSQLEVFGYTRPLFQGIWVGVVLCFVMLIFTKRLHGIVLFCFWPSSCSAPDQVANSKSMKNEYNLMLLHLLSDGTHIVLKWINLVTSSSVLALSLCWGSGPQDVYPRNYCCK